VPGGTEAYITVRGREEQGTHSKENEILGKGCLLVSVPHVESNVKHSCINCEDCAGCLAEAEEEEDLEGEVEAAGLLYGRHD
jgi:hypothetical protein